MTCALLGPAAGRLRARFRSARPCRHVVIDGFLEPALARAVARELPAAGDPRFGESADGLSILRSPAVLGPAFARLEELTASARFLEALGRLSGTTGLRRNAEASCGGLFRYDDRAELDVHVDSNDVDVHCAQSGNRRKVNLLLYLAPGWRHGWGGRFDLYGSPSRPPEVSVAPLFNRCVLFSSHDRSWHGVSPVTLPPGAAGVSRFALIHNFYVPAPVRAARPHYNIFLPRPLPASVRAGRTLTAADALEVARLLARRDERIEGLRRLERGAPAASPAARPDPFALLDALPPAARPGRPLTLEGLAALRRLFGERDRELRRLYRGQYDAVRRLKRTAPGLVPRGY